MNIHVLSPYRRQFAYPSFWKLLQTLSEGGELINPIDNVHDGILKAAYDTKLKHILPLLSSLWIIIRTRKVPDAFITFGSYQICFILILKIFFRKAKYITYQPELFEFDSKLLTSAFRLSVASYDLFIDVEPKRLKLRQRYFRGMAGKPAVVLPNFNHTLAIPAPAAANDVGFVYAGVIDSENSLVRFCTEFGISSNAIDCYITKCLDGQAPTQLRFFEPRPFEAIAEVGYRFGLICYPFVNGVRGSLNNKYCAPSKLFSYLAFGILPVHYGHPTLKRFVKDGISTDKPGCFNTLVVDPSVIRVLFDEMSRLVIESTEVIVRTIKPAPGC